MNATEVRKIALQLKQIRIEIDDHVTAFADGYMTAIADGKTLDNIGRLNGLKRKRYFWFFKEWDSSYRMRIIKFMRYREDPEL